MKYAVLFVFFSAVIAVGQDRAEPGHQKNIVGGEDAGIDEFSFVAKIVYGGSQVGCTGSLIADNKVLTAAHCVAGRTTRSIAVAFGNYRTQGTRYQATGIAPHPQYSGDPHHKNDIAIIEFYPAVRNIKPVRILRLEEEDQWIPEVAYGVAVGWGGTDASDNPPLPSTLKKVAIPIYRESQCGLELRKLINEGKRPQHPEIDYRILCAGEEGRGTGAGDSGGPLLVRTTKGWAQVGVLSQAMRNPSTEPERVVYMSTYIRTALVYKWIHPRPEAYHLYFAHSASGGGWETDILLLNPQSTPVEAAVEMSGGRRIDLPGAHYLTVPGKGMEEWTFPIPISGRASSGVVTVTSNEKLFGFLRFRHVDGSITSVSSTPLASKFMLPVSGKADRIGLAIYNSDPNREAKVKISPPGCSPVYWILSPEEKRARFLDEIVHFRNCGEGALLIEEAYGLEITVLALEVTDGNLVTLPAVVLE